MPVFVGFMPKRVVSRPDWLPCPNVEEICSVSDCFSKAPDDWMEHWLHNGAGFFNDEALAAQVVPEHQRGEYDLFAYRLWPLEFEAGQVRAMDPRTEFARLPDGLPTGEPSLANYLSIGLDLVSRSSSAFVECSPLSCNGRCEEFQINRYCLLNDVETALRAGQLFSDPGHGAEPGAYYLFEVLRRSANILGLSGTAAR